MLPTVVSDLAIYQGDDYTLTVTFLDGDGDPVDLSDSSFIPNVAPANPGIGSTANFTVDTSMAGSGVITLSLDGAATAIVKGPTSEPVWYLLWDLAETGVWNKTLFTGRIALKVQV